jgi:hypothetical protein
MQPLSLSTEDDAMLHQPMARALVTITASALLAVLGGCGGDTNVSSIVDPNHPRVVGAVSESNTSVLVSFSEAVLGGADSAENPSHYQITQYESAGTGGAGADKTSRKSYLSVAKATLSADKKSVRLDTLSQADIKYLLTVSNVKDLKGNPIAGSSGVDSPATAIFVGTAPTQTDQKDSDADGLTDSAEQRGWTVTVLLVSGTAQQKTVTSDPFDPDTDGDGIGDATEKQFGIDPRSKDTDTDELTDYQELVEIYSDPSRQDTDGDTLTDGLEFNFFKLSPSLADSDGDQILDADEIQLANRNPRISDLPLPGIEVGDVDLRLDVRFRAQSSTGSRELETRTATTTLTQSNSKLYSNTDSSTNKFFAKAGVEQGWGVKEGVASGKFTFETGYSGEWTSSTRRDRAEASQKAYLDSLKTESEVTQGETITREVLGASMKVAVSLRSLGDIAFSIRNIQITALLQDPRNPAVLLPIATLVADPSVGGLDTVNLGPLIPARGPFVFANTQVFPSLVEDLMRDPRGLVFKIANFDITDEFGRNFAFTSQGINDRTAALVIDFGGADVDGDMEGEATERLRISTAAGRPVYDSNGDGVVDDQDRRVLFDREGHQVGITIRDALENALGLKHYDEDATPSASLSVQQLENSYSTRLVGVDKDGDGVQDGQVHALWRIRKVSRDLDNPLKNWSVLTQTGIDGRVDVFDRLMSTGSGLVFAFVQDLDDDGIPARWEYVYGCSDTNSDTDGDGLNDRLEVFEGWTVDIVGQGSSTVLSSCARADTDGDGLGDVDERRLGIDPKSVDTDSDGVGDADEVNGYLVQLRFESDPATSQCTVPPGTPTGFIFCKTDPRNADTDYDGGRDGDEIAFGTDPTVNDGDKFLDDDSDGLVNYFETQIGWAVSFYRRAVTCEEQGNPAGCVEPFYEQGQLVSYLIHSNPTHADQDRDGLTDRMERDLGTDPAIADTDGDGLKDSDEVSVVWTSGNSYTFEVHTDPLDADTDDDLLSDGSEISTPWLVSVRGETPVQVYSDPLVADADFDVFPDYFERRSGTHPQRFDTDSDGHGDGAEVDPARGTDPLTPDQLVNFRYLSVTAKGGCDVTSTSGKFYGKWQFDASGLQDYTGTAVVTVFDMPGWEVTEGNPYALPSTAQRNYVMRAGDVLRAQIVDVIDQDADNDDELESHTPKDVSYEASNETAMLENREPGGECRLETTLLVTVK